ncbi:hypothetical protein BD770DRAFT_441849 [Pilaira anomala]|nr:hypothetical protein BD770DRAFT_441849 [Pilaira anomala]
MFQRRIQLATDEPSRWSIPCCSSFRSRGIQLSEDSDHEEEEQEQQQQSLAPFRIESTSFLQHSSNLSRNPFARVEDISPKAIFTPQVETQTGRTEELVDVNRNKYENEPDWTEIHEEEEEEEDIVVALPTLTKRQDTKEDGNVVEEVEVEEQGQEEEQEEEEEEEEEEIPKKEEKIPQIEKEVLHLLPLPQLSNEFPPAMIHKKPSFEKSMYGEAPLMSTTTRPNNNRISRFSMTEEDFLALKRQEETKNNIRPLVVKTMSSPMKEMTVLSGKEITASPVEMAPASTKNEFKKIMDPLSIPEDSTTTSKQVTQRRSSIAQSILGDKLDDFTEKLAFIKKNIIMNIDSDDDEEEADNAEQTLKKIASLKPEQSTSSVPTEIPRPLHRRTSSLMDVAPTLARFIHQIGAGPDNSTPREGEEEDEDEELFDFTKVIEIGKNVRTFGEGFVGNGIRMFNDVATRIKTSAEEEADGEKESEPENWINDSYI